MYKDLDSVILVKDIKGRDQYGDLGELCFPKGEIGTIVNVFDDGVCEVEFIIPDPDIVCTCAVLEVKENDLAPYRPVKR